MLLPDDNYNFKIMNKEKKIYCGSGKKQSENWIKATINVEKFREHIQEYNGTKFLKLNININDEPDQYGKDVSITIDTWQPSGPLGNKEEKETKSNVVATKAKSIKETVLERNAAKVKEQDDFDDLPFN